VLSAARPLKDTMPQAQASNRAPSLQAMRART
jgi:hypothetical protein